ncbi:hypothetical protein [Methanosarcina sp.]|uniref:hypothetical protein n=1 Tax=Methanosarcina sp. TaxID=2213 RepID=UPI002ABBC739|nr:hypothetical protein [Methanosarcina sp.]MDY9924990.1 hypothetical protein [Methanosarcina sp.]
MFFEFYEFISRTFKEYSIFITENLYIFRTIKSTWTNIFISGLETAPRNSSCKDSFKRDGSRYVKFIKYETDDARAGHYNQEAKADPLYSLPENRFVRLFESKLKAQLNRRCLRIMKDVSGSRPKRAFLVLGK